MTGAYLVAALLFFGLAAWAHLAFWTRRLNLPLSYARVEQLQTPDGATIELRRIAEPSGSRSAVPVLLVHGLAANHRNNDLHPDYSLARYLAEQGRDVWLLTLRSGRATRGAARRRVRFDAMARFDLPTAIDAVRERSGAARLDYLGFSMGGMLLYAALARSVNEARLRRVVICGSPATIGVRRLSRWLVRKIPRALVPGVPMRLLSRLFAFAAEWFSTPFHSVIVNHRNVPPGLTRASMVNLVEDIPASLQADFVDFARDGRIHFEGSPALDGLAEVGTPALFLAGAADNLAPISSVRRAFDAWGANRHDVDKTFVSLGRAFGHKEDYGHGDLAFGRHVTTEVFPIVAEFLRGDHEAQGQ